MLDQRSANNGRTNSSVTNYAGSDGLEAFTYSSDCRSEAVGQPSERAEILLETLEL